jgi:hypothetical protein
MLLLAGRTTCPWRCLALAETVLFPRPGGVCGLCNSLISIMAASSTQILRMPGEHEHELWNLGGNDEWKPAPEERNATPCILAVECLAMDSAPFWSVAPPETAVDPVEMVALHWEGLGVDTTGEGRNFCYWRAGEEQGRVLIATMALASEAPQDQWMALLPERFEPSAFLMPIPKGECALWKELERYVMAFTRGEHLVHVAVLNSRALDVEAAREICDLMRALEVRGLSECPKSCRIWTMADAAFIDALKQDMGIKGRVEPKPVPRLPKTPTGLLPTGVARKREEKARQSQYMRLVATVSLACLAFFTSWVGWLLIREQRVERKFARLSLQEPQVQAVRNAQLRWAALEPAVEPDLYPVEVFYQIVSLLPPEGIQLQEFAIDTDKLVVGGVASTTSHALKFQDAVQHCEPLHRYAWNFQQLSIKEDNRAIFRGEGVLQGGALHEGE